MQKGLVAFICVLSCSHFQVDSAILRTDVAQDSFLQVDQDESEQELAELHRAAEKLQAFCQSMQNETNAGVPRGATGIASDSIADPHCTRGVVSPDLKACCAKECGSCGTHKLCGKPGKFNEATGLLVDQCCYGNIMGDAPSCDKDHPPCKLSPSYKETLKKWTQDIPARHAMQDCNKAIPKTRNSHDNAIDKGEFLADLYLKGETKYKEALQIATTVEGKCDEKIAEGEKKAADAEKKIGKANKADSVKNQMTGESAVTRWEDQKAAGEGEASFYQQIKDNAQKIMKESKVGLESVKKLREDAQKLKDVSPLQQRFNALIIDAEDTYQEALKLWKQWQDSTKDYDCGAPPPVKNAESICKDGNTKFSPTCQIKCAKGYDGNGTSNHLRCEKVGKFGEQLSGEWTGMASCTGRQCGVPPHIKHAKTVLTEIRYPEASTYNCLEGFFNPSGGHSFNIPCGTDGFFETNSSHICKGVSCGKAPQLNGTEPVKGEFTYSMEANYTCLKGYTLDGLPGGRTFFHTYCQATGKFTHGNMGCQKIRCGPVPNFAFTSVTHLTTQDQDDQHYGDTAKYTCDSGYTLDQQADGPNEFTLVCHEDGEFSLEGSKGDSQMHQPRCQPICIGKPPPIPHGVFSKREMCYGDTEMVVAEDGYSTKASPTTGLSFFLGVSTTGHFTGLTELLPVKCGSPPGVVKATTEFGKDEAVYEDVVHYECAKGYSTDKSKDPGAAKFSIQCQSDGTFTALPALGECANIDDCVGHTCGAHGTCEDHLMNYTCSCDSGFAMTWHKEAKQLVCGNINDCGPEACGVGKCIDEVNSYKCDCPSGYKQVSETTSGQVDHTCAPVICGTPTKVDHASITPAELVDQKVSFGTTMLYQCAVGYTLDGKVGGKAQFNSKCQADKSFSHGTESCSAITCGKPPEVANSAPSASSAKFKETLEYQCATGYSLDGTASGDKAFTITCQATGAFTAELACQKISCGEAPDTSHAHHPMKEVLYEGTAEYECFSGFTIDGTKDGASTFSVECKDDGNFTELKQCEAKVCGELKASDFENAHFKDEGEIAYPMATEITCKDGFTTDGHAEGNKTFTVGCLASGDFEKFDSDTCKPVVCGTPPPAPNATIVSSKAEMVFGDHVTYECLVGFTTGGEQDAPMTYDLACLANGGFSSPTPDMLCRNVNDCEGHTCGPYGVCVDEIGPAPAYTCNCEYGYIIKTEASGEKHCGNKDDCKGADCGMGVCKDLIGSYTCDCPGGYYVGLGADGKKTCLPVVCVDEVPVVEFGKLQSHRTGAVVFPTTLTYMCEQGYSSDGTPTEARRKFQAQCKADGILHGLAACQPVSCGTAPVVEHSKLLEPDTSVDSIDYKEIAKYECDVGYTLKGKVGGETIFEIKCLDDGHMEDPQVCEPVTCGTAPSYPNSKSGIGHAMHFGQTAQYECSFGYTLDGTAGGLNEYDVACLSNGSFSDMHTDSPCKPVSVKIPTITHAKLTKYMGFEMDPEIPPPEMATYPNTVTFQCDVGFTVTGLSSGAKTMSSMVSSSGEFFPALPTECVAITYVIRGLARDAPTANYLDGVQVHIKDTNYEGTSSNGHFTVQHVPAGSITVEYHREGYISGEKVLDLESDISTGGAADISMSPVMSADAWRAVLKWGVTPRDLDTYGKWSSYKTCWYQKTQNDGVMGARLEHDDTDSYGPETLHLTGVGKCTGPPEFCDIKYSVNDYTETGIMGETDVEVTVYNGDRIAGTWKIADCQSSVSPDQLWWHVFSIDGTTNQLKWNCNQGPPPENQGGLEFFHKGQGNHTKSLRGKH